MRILGNDVGGNFFANDATGRACLLSAHGAPTGWKHKLEKCLRRLDAERQDHPRAKRSEAKRNEAQRVGCMQCWVAFPLKITLSCIQYLRQLRKAEGGLNGMNTAQAGNPVENLG
jgi:hypothetical protein